MNEFTKGFWEVVYAGPSPIGVGVAMKGNSIVTAYEMILNPVFKGKTDDDVPEIVATMQLVAAAPDMYEALKDPFSYECGDFADALLELGDKLGKLDEVGIAVWKLWILKKAEDIQAALAKAEGK